MIPRQITILCDGGLGNRLSGLVGGLHVAHELGLRPTIAWPENNWCGCSFYDLFANINWTVTDHNVFRVFQDNSDSVFVIHENQTNVPLTTVLSHSTQTLDQLRGTDAPIVYYHNKLPPYVSEAEAIVQLQQLNINSDIKQQVNEFCQINRIDNHVAGLHLRKTENRKLDEQSLYQQVQTTPDQRYFVCSDDQATEQRFCCLPNVQAQPKTSYVGKMTAGDWYESIVDSDGRATKYNINRSRQSVIEAFVDMLILSRTWIRPTVKSSFANFARYFAQVKYTHEQEKMEQ